MDNLVETLRKVDAAERGIPGVGKASPHAAQTARELLVGLYVGPGTSITYDGRTVCADAAQDEGECSYPDTPEAA